MKISLITKKEYKILLKIFKDSPSLTLQNIGYEYINRNKLINKDVENLKQVETILSSSIIGFRKFSNFKLNKNNEIQLRFQYNWNAESEDNRGSFIGVGYILLEELLNGFKK